MPEMKGVSKSEFARREKCDEKLVRRKLQQGYLVALPDGSLDPALVGTDWRKRVYKPRKPKVVDVEINETEEEETARKAADRYISQSGFTMLTEAQAKAKKENYLALLTELKYDIAAGKVVLISDVMDAITGELARVRSQLTQLPSVLAEQLLLKTNPEEVKVILDTAIEQVLSELTYDERFDLQNGR